MKYRDSNEKKIGLSVGEVAKRSGVTVSALHFYERKGLISSSRNNSNQRIYERNMLRRIAVIKTAQTLGIPLAEIKKALNNLPKDSIATRADWQKLSEKWKEDLNNRIEKLTKLRDQLTYCIGCGCLSIEDCRLRNPFDELGKKDSGAILLN